jgi:hypothetical protein
VASSVTLTSLIASVRRRANIENQTAFIPDAEITEYLNAGLAALYDMLVQAGAQPWYRNSYTITTTGNTTAYDLPADFYEMQSVDVQLGNGGIPTISARPYMEFERNRYKYYPGWLYGTPVYYRLQGSTINFIPAPGSTYNVTLNYYPVFPKLASGSDSFDGVNGWEEYAIWKATADCKAKLEEDPSYALGAMAKLEQKIQSMSEQRDTGAAERMTETDADGWPYFGVTMDG